MIAVGLLALAVASAAPATDAATDTTEAGAGLRIEIDGFRNDEGQALVLVFGSKAGFPGNEDKAFHKWKGPIEDGRVVLELNDVPPGTYAVSAVHDENSSGKLGCAMRRTASGGPASPARAIRKSTPPAGTRPSSPAPSRMVPRIAGASAEGSAPRPPRCGASGSATAPSGRTTSGLPGGIPSRYTDKAAC